MSFLPVYLDSSALLKLIVPERESQSLEQMLKSWPDWVSSVLAGVECRRALKRIGVPASVTRRADAVLNATVLVKVDEPVLRLADRLGPSVVRSLDAIHLATALSMGDDPAAFVSYDDRLAAAARTLKLHVLQPGRA